VVFVKVAFVNGEVAVVFECLIVMILIGVDFELVMEV